MAAEHATIFASVNNADVELDLPWCPFPASVAVETLRANFTGAVEVCEAFLPLLMPGGRTVNVSSGAGSMNLDKMSRDKRSLLMRGDLSVPALCACRDEFLGAFQRLHAADEPSLPKMGEEGWWMQAYGFSKALLNAYTRVLARQSPALLVTACTPGFVATEMTGTYDKLDTLKTPEEGAVTPVMLVLAASQDVESGSYYADDRTVTPWCTQGYDV